MQKMHILPVTVRYTFYTDKQYYSAERNGHMKAKKVNEAKAVSESGEWDSCSGARKIQLRITYRR